MKGISLRTLLFIKEFLFYTLGWVVLNMVFDAVRGQELEVFGPAMGGLIFGVLMALGSYVQLTYELEHAGIRLLEKKMLGRRQQEILTLPHIDMEALKTALEADVRFQWKSLSLEGSILRGETKRDADIGRQRIEIQKDGDRLTIRSASSYGLGIEGVGVVNYRNLEIIKSYAEIASAEQPA